MYNISRSCILQPVFRKMAYPPVYVCQTRLVTLKPILKDNTDNLPFIERNEALKRPISPHLSIYKIQMTSVLSITHRVTGVAAGVYLFAFSTYALCPYDIVQVTDFIKGLELSPLTGIAIKTVLALPFSYHTANGIRHLIWDFGKFLTNDGVVKSGYTVLLLTAILTGVLISL